MEVKKPRPINLDLQTISFPIAAIASIVHRVSGVITFISVAILLSLLNLSLSSPDGFDLAFMLVNGFFIKFVLWGILTALAYHIVGGIRHMLMELGHFEELESGATSAKITFYITALLSFFAGYLVW